MPTGSLMCAVFLFVLAIPFLFGKGAKLIAGYNTASEKEKAKYDELKLCRMVALLLILVGSVFVLHALKIISMNDCILLGVSIVLIGCVLANIVTKKKK